MKIIKDIVFSGNEKLDIYLPDTTSFSACYVFFHGGGIVNGTKNEANLFAKYFADRNVCVVSAEYRLFPNTKFPEFLQDCACAVKWTMDNIHLYGKCEKFFVGGSSAGGYISMMLCFDKQYLGFYGISPLDIAGFIHDSGQPTVHFNVLAYSGDDPKKVVVDSRAPLYHVGSEKEYPPMAFIVSDNDLPNRYEQLTLTYSTLKNFGYDMDKIEFHYRHGEHCEHVNTFDENGDNNFAKLIFPFFEKNF